MFIKTPFRNAAPPSAEGAKTGLCTRPFQQEQQPQPRNPQKPQGQGVESVDPQSQAGGQTALGQGTQIQFQLLANQEGQPFFPAFTGWEELRKLCGPKNQQTLVLTFDDYTAMVVRDTRAAGFVVDPFGSCLSFDRAMVELSLIHI